MVGLDERHADRASEVVRHLLVLFGSLNEEATKHGQDLWRAKPKIRMIWELTEFQAPLLGSPRAYWNYMDEDFVGWIGKALHSRGRKACGHYGYQDFAVLQRPGRGNKTL